MNYFVCAEFPILRGEGSPTGGVTMSRYFGQARTERGAARIFNTAWPILAREGRADSDRVLCPLPIVVRMYDADDRVVRQETFNCRIVELP